MVAYRWMLVPLPGGVWRFWNCAAPLSVAFAEGSEVAVYPPTDSTSVRA